MLQNEKSEQNVITYEIDNKKYKVITRCVENPRGIEELYEVICKLIHLYF